MDHQGAGRTRRAADMRRQPPWPSMDDPGYPEGSAFPGGSLLPGDSGSPGDAGFSGTGPLRLTGSQPVIGSGGGARPGLAAGTGEVFSYVVHHHPPVPGKRLPMVVALVQLPEGVRILGEMPGVRPDQVRIGLPVRVTFTRAGDMSLPSWGLRGGSGGIRVSSPPEAAERPAERVEGSLPDRVIDVTPTFVIASALATRDFQDVHHDRDRAVARGARDIFLNILTTTGLVQRYVSAWAPDAVVRAVSIRLGVPCHAGETLTLSGQVTAADGDEQVVAVTGRCSLGDHVTATVRITR